MYLLSEARADSGQCSMVLFSLVVTRPTSNSTMSQVLRSPCTAYGVCVCVADRKLQPSRQLCLLAQSVHISSVQAAAQTCRHRRQQTA